MQSWKKWGCYKTMEYWIEFLKILKWFTESLTTYCLKLNLFCEIIILSLAFVFLSKLGYKRSFSKDGKSCLNKSMDYLYIKVTGYQSVYLYVCVAKNLSSCWTYMASFTVEGGNEKCVMGDVKKSSIYISFLGLFFHFMTSQMTLSAVPLGPGKHNNYSREG